MVCLPVSSFIHQDDLILVYCNVLRKEDESEPKFLIIEEVYSYGIGILLGSLSSLMWFVARTALLFLDDFR